MSSISVRGVSAPQLALALIASLLGALLIWSRFAGISQSLWHDEVFTVLTYTGTPLAPFRETYVPNNHVLFSLLAAITIDVLGDGEVAYRLWSVLPAIASVGVISWWAWRRLGAAAGVGVLALLTMSPLHLELSRQARGYGLAFLAMAVVVMTAVDLSEEARTRHLVLLGLGGTVGIVTLPVFVLPFVLVIAVLFATTRDLRMIAVLVAVGATSLLWYSPMLSELVSSTGQEFGVTLGPADVFTQPVVDLLVPSFSLIAAGVPTALWVLVTYLLAALVFIRARVVGRAGWATVGAAAIGPYAILALLRFHTADRFMSYLLVPAVLLVAMGTASQIDLGPAWRRVVTGTVAGLALVLMAANFLPLAREVAATPRENFAEVAAVVRSVDDPDVFTNSERPLGLDYYIDEELQMIEPTSATGMCEAAPPLVYIEHPYRSPDIDESCLEARGAERVRVLQRSRGAYIDVWVLSASE